MSIGRQHATSVDNYCHTLTVTSHRCRPLMTPAYSYKYDPGARAFLHLALRFRGRALKLRVPGALLGIAPAAS